MITGTRTQKRPTAPDSLAVFLCLLNGAMPAIFGRVERRNTIPHVGNMPGAAFVALVETRLPATNWKSLNTKTQKEAFMPNPNHGQVTPALNTIETALISAIDQTAMAHSILNDLSSLFTAIRKNTDRSDLNHNLAGIGQYLADEWATLLDRQSEELNALMEVKS